jgi:anti-sigma regulatory factor (Ser/Thr protein kinase)
MPHLEKFELWVTNNFSELRAMSLWLHNICEHLALPESLTKDLDVCVNEAITNIILYAYEDQESHRILIQIEANQNQELCLTIQDNGFPFDPFTFTLPDTYEKIAGMNIGGLGIQLMKNLANQCHYQLVNNKNIITLRFSNYTEQPSLAH